MHSPTVRPHEYMHVTDSDSETAAKDVKDSDSETDADDVEDQSQSEPEGGQIPGQPQSASQFYDAPWAWLVPVTYHSICVLIVTVALCRDWLSLNSGLAWELWFVWQQLCLWSLG